MLCLKESVIGAEQLRCRGRSHNWQEQCGCGWLRRTREADARPKDDHQACNCGCQAIYHSTVFAMKSTTTCKNARQLFVLDKNTHYAISLPSHHVVVQAKCNQYTRFKHPQWLNYPSTKRLLSHSHRASSAFLDTGSPRHQYARSGLKSCICKPRARTAYIVVRPSTPREWKVENTQNSQHTSVAPAACDKGTYTIEMEDWF